MMLHLQVRHKNNQCEQRHQIIIISFVIFHSGTLPRPKEIALCGGKHNSVETNGYVNKINWFILVHGPLKQVLWTTSCTRNRLRETYCLNQIDIFKI